MKTRAFIGLGANLGFARDAVLNALADLSLLPSTEFVAASGLYRSTSLGSDGPEFVNAVAEIGTDLEPLELLHLLLAIEKRYGRVRTERNAPRTLDLDLLVFGDTVLSSAELTLPHPRMTERAFVLKPLAELAPELNIPGHGTVESLLPAVDDQDAERLDD